ncbi:alpha-L-fucosidase [Catalinimonas alkaloidigena]|uniref:alpha-L-fucosidase n=1 Tax=Catalinimonas alkaloidigena TaxID=1075417 RepID=UPI001FE08246|nr:alpha-L-fucosidase [Catalinimonas alkaloidigena]
MSVLSARAQADYQPTAENLQAREWFQDAKYGMFIHWGVYSVVGGGGDRGVAEWLMQQKQISVDDYEQLPHYFNPTAFDAKAWVQLAKDAGMHYITITSKHHDGFAMYDSQVSDYDIVDRTPYGKDVLKLLKDECDRQGIKLFFYHSQLDWHHPGYYPRGRTGQYTGRPDEGNWQHYLDYQNAQLTELLTHYGDVAGIWFDGWWDKAEAPAWKLDETYALIHKLQPQALIGNNHHRAPFPGEDFQMFEKDLPGHNTTGFGSSANDIGTLPRETCETMNGSWGYNLTDDRYKSTKDLVHYLVRAAGYNANFLLNVGPQPNGEIQSEFQDTLRAVGTWLQTYGPTVYGTRGGPVAPKTWGVTTQKDNKVYVHVLDYADRTLLIPDFKGRVKSARLFNSGSKVKYQTNAYGLLLELPQNRTGDLDTVIELTL